MPLPNVVTFIPCGQSGLFASRHFYRKLGFRCPMKGEYYLSGAIVQAWQAPNDLTTEFMVVEKGPLAVRRTIEVPA